MGRRDGIRKTEVAEILGVSVSLVSRMVTQGRLKIKYYEGKQPLFDEEEVHALHEAMQRGATPQKVLETAQQSWASARVAHRRLDALEQFLGLHTVPLIEVNLEGVQDLHSEVVGALGRRINGAEKINYWSDRFFGMCEEHLFLIEDLLGAEDPWKPYTELSSQLLRDHDFSSLVADPAEVMAFKRLRGARDHLRRVVFMYMLQRHGKQKAIEHFPSEFGGSTHDIMVYALESRRM
jgi:excisionase family DNA binding protein